MNTGDHAHPAPLPARAGASARGRPAPVRRAARGLGRVLRAPLRRRTWAELAYVLAGTLLAPIGACYVVVALAVGAGLAVTAAGVPLLVLGLHGARLLGGLHRRLARTLLGERIDPPSPPRRARGFYGRLGAGLSDAAAWRAAAYLLLQLPMAFLRGYVVLLTWAWGVLALTYPLQWAAGLNQDPTAGGRRGLAAAGLRFDTPGKVWALSAAGAALLLAAPWAVHLVVLADRPLRRRLLGRHELSERVRDLEETRARAVDDAAATLRRIERDLHDGPQVRLVAVTMQLAMARDTMPEGPARDLVGTAQRTAREAIAELRELVRGIHPPVLDGGLHAALASLAERSPVPVRLRIDVRVRPTPAIESIAYFCAAELLANVAKHSGASRAVVEAVQTDDRLVLRVRDDGPGGAAVGAGSGLRGLGDRVRTVDGRLDIDSPPGGPTVVTVDLPMRA